MRNKTDELGKAFELMQANLHKLSEDCAIETFKQSGLNCLSENLIADNSINQFAIEIISFFSKNFNTQIATFYFTENNISTPQYSVGLSYNDVKNINNRDQFLDEAVSDKKIRFFNKLLNKCFVIEPTLNTEKLFSLLVIPVLFDDEVVAVIELVKYDEFPNLEMQCIEEIRESISVSVKSVREKLDPNRPDEKLNEKEINNLHMAINRSNSLIEMDLNGYVLKSNKSFCDLIGYSEIELIGKHHSLFVEPEIAKSEEYRNFWKALNNGEFLNGNFKRINKKGESVWINGAYNPIFNLDGKLEKIVKIANDITEFKNHQTEFSQQIDSVNTSAIISETDADGNITFVNDLFCNISGYSREELLGKNHSHLRSGKQPDELFFGMWKTIKLGNTWKGEIENIKRDGDFYWVDTTIVPYKDANGVIYKYVEIRFEITKQKELQDALKNQTEELKVQQEKLQEANAELEAQTQKLQASEEELKVQQEELMKANHELIEKSQLLEEKNQAVNKKNKELEAASNELQTKAQELSLSSKYKSVFLANMSHELRTPLNSILLLSRLLADNGDSNLSKEQIEFASVIHNSGNSLLELIDDILDLSKIESGKMDIDIESVQVDFICKNVVDLFKSLFKEKGILFSVNFENNIANFINTDRSRVEQVLKNFLSNAFKFTENGSVEFIVRKPNVSDTDKLKIDPANYIAFEVKDSGIGIPAEKHAMVFQAFQQADGSTRRKYGGTGLGLSISREIASMLGGEIVLNSEYGKGSSFTLVIPLDSSDSKYTIDQNNVAFIRNEDIALKQTCQFLVPDENIVSFIPEEILDDRYDISKNDKTILIVEDDTTFAQALVKYIHERGYKAVVVVNGANALNFAVKYKPIGILLDIQLPIKSGWTILKEFKGNQVTKYIPVHMMSSLEISTSDILHHGAVDFIYKPMEKKDLCKMLDGLERLLGKEPKKILLVDNNEMHTTAISSFIGDNGIVCLSSATAKEAFHILKIEAIECIVIEIDLPDENGFEFIETIKNDKSLEKIPIIIYTRKSFSLQEQKKIMQFANAIIIKTAESFKRLASELSLFLNQVECVNEMMFNNNAPCISDKVLANKHILIVDDDVRNIFSLTKLLESQKMKISSASDGDEALMVLNSDKSIELVVLDMMMPNKDGYETIEDIRKSLSFNKLPVIAVTAKAMLGDREKCINAGASDYVAKPIVGEQLISLLKVWLNK